MAQTGSFSQALGIAMDEKTVERAPEWSEVAGEFVGDVAAGAADGALHVGGAISGGVAALGEAAGKGAAVFGAAVAGGAREVGKMLENVDLGKVAENLPFKFPFGR